MEISYAQLRNAKGTLDYVNGIKQEIENLIYSKTRLIYSGIALSELEYSHAIQCINESIDDLFRHEIRQCRQITETWQQQEGRRAEAKWHVPSQ